MAEDEQMHSLAINKLPPYLLYGGYVLAVVLVWLLLEYLYFTAGDFIYLDLMGAKDIGERSVDDGFSDYYYIRYWVCFHIISGIGGAALCFKLSGFHPHIKRWRFALCGFVWWALTIAFLISYPLIKNQSVDESIERKYNFYSFCLGWLFFVAFAAAYFIYLYLFKHAEGLDSYW